MIVSRMEEDNEVRFRCFAAECYTCGKHTKESDTDLRRERALKNHD